MSGRAAPFTKRAAILLAILLAAMSGAFAQKLPIKTFTTADGLATSIIHHVANDSQGFLWFAGRGGLSRWDGREFVSFKLEDQAAPLVHKFLESRDRKLRWTADS